MNKTRRDFIKASVRSSLSLPLIASGFGSVLHAEELDELNAPLRKKKLRILLLWGTSFLGIHQIDYALSRGHEVTIFTRGKTKPTYKTELFDRVEHLIGDRKDNLAALENGTFKTLERAAQLIHE
jgi:2'-hydroxyisoflavone reductase